MSSAINPLPSSGTSGDKRSYEPSMEEILASIRRIIADDQGLPVRGAPVSDPASTVESSRDLLRKPAPHRPAAPAPADPASSTAAPRATESHEPAPSALAEDDAGLAEDGIALHEVAAQEITGQEGAAQEVTTPEITAHGPIAAPQYPSPDGRIGDGGVTRLGHRPSPPAVAPPEPDRPAAAEETFEELSFLHDPILPEPFETGAEMFDEPIAPKPAVDPTPLFSATTDAAVSSAFSMLAASRLADNSEELMTIAKEMIRPMLRAWLDDNLPSMVERMVRAEIERVARGGR